MALSWTTGTFTGNQNIDALFWTSPYYGEGGVPARWVGTSFTFSFPTDATFYEGSGGYANGGPQDNNFEAFNALQQEVARTVFAWVESFTPLTFSEVTETVDVHADFRFAMTNAATTAYATPPSSETELGQTSEMEGDSWYKNAGGQYDNPTPGTYAFHTILHEIGHNLGLKHGHDQTGGAGALESQYDSNEYSVMTYRNYVGQNTGSGYGIPEGHGVQSFMMFDIAALQELYGADFTSDEANAGHSVYTFSPTTGTMSINGVAGTAPGANVIFRTIWDGNGTDTYDFSNYTTDQQIDLRPGEWSVLDPAQIADLDLSNTHHARGNIANALLYHGDLRSLIENANGGSGADDITGNVGANVLRGFGGNDLLDGGSGADSLVGGIGADTVLGDAGDDLLDGDQGIAISASAPIVKPVGFWNNSIETALRIDGAFNLAANANIQNALTRPHVTIEGTGDGTRDYYAFTVTANGSVGTFDVDGAWPGFDSYLSLFDVSGTQIAFSDDSTPDAGSVGVISTLDSFITHAFASAGTYYIAVGSFPGLAPVPSGDPYTLHVSLDASSSTLAGGADSLNGGEGNDTLMGFVGNDTLEGAAGDDTLDGGADSDTASYAGAGTVTVNLSIAGAQNTVGAGWDTLVAIENLSGSAFADTLTGDTGGNHLAGAGGNDTLAAGTGNDTVDGGAGDDAMDGGADADTVSYASSGTGAVTVNLSIAAAQNTVNAGFDTFTGFENLLGSAFGDTLVGNTGGNRLDGAGGNDTLHGSDGNDTLEGGAGDDSINGGNNDDTLMGSVGNDTLEGAAGDDSLDGGADTDTASYASAGAVTVNLSITAAQNTVNAGLDTLTAIENILGSAFGDTLTGNAGANNLAGAAGNDYLAGGAENDTLIGGAGDDSLDGGTGTDTVSYAGAGAVTVILAIPVAQNTIGAGLDTLIAIENLLGSAFGDTLIGNTGSNRFDGAGGNDTLYGSDGNDTLDGGTGVDSMDGGAGDDLYYVETAGDVAAEAFNDAPAGIDTVESSIGHALGFGMENLTLTGAAAINGIGNANDNVMTGNAADNGMDGSGGDDTMIGGAGNDLLLGKDGADSILGGDGDDTLLGGTDNDTLIGGAGSDTAYYYNSGSAITVSMLASTASSSTEGTDWLVGLEWVTGSNAFDDTLSAAGTSVGINLRGWGGNDTVIGGAGNDWLVGDDGVDTASYASAGAVTVNLTVDVAQNTVGAGSDRLTFIENVLGSAFGDTLTGDTNGNLLAGAGGNDMLAGGAGDDTLDGGADIDTASYAGAGAVTVSLAMAGAQNTGGAGFDTLTAIENILGSAVGDTLTGNSGANHLAGAGGNDTLSGSTGKDTLDGGAGADSMNAGDHDDLYIVDDAGDVTFESFNDELGGVDTVEASATHTLGFGLEHLTLTGSAAIGGTGNANNNVVTGNAAVNTLAGLGGNDTLIGGAGNDTLEGGAGDDSLDGGTGSDTVSYAGAGPVTVILSIPGAQNTIGAGLDTLIAIESLLGSAFGDTLVGNTGGNSLDGAGGNDTLYGSDGNDTLNGAAGNDNLQGGSGADSLHGGDNDDFLLGQAGDDAVIGGTGFDTADYFNVAAAMTVSMLAGAATSSAEGTDTLLEIERVYGSNTFGDSMSAAGTSVGMAFAGWGGNDTLTSGAGDDTLSGGAGNDTVSYAGAGGAVKVDLSITAAQNTMGAGSDTLDQIEYLLGSEFGDTLMGDANGNLLAGAGGNDTLEGAASDDSLDGGAGNDSLSGSAGDDGLEGGSGIDWIGGGAGNDFVDGGTENDHAIGGVGTDTLLGGAGDDLIEGDQGIAISALAPIAKPASFWNDSPGTALWIDGAFNLDANANIQNALTRPHVTINGVGGGTQDYYAFTVTAGASFGTFDIDGADPGFDSYLTLLDANGTILASSEDFLTDPGSVGGQVTLDSFITRTFASQGTYYIVVGGSPSDSTVVPPGAPYALHVSLDAPSNTLAGGADSLSGGEGNDTLDGGIGDDTLIGGAGNDRYVVDSAADVVTEGSAQGTDLIQSSVSIDALAANVEKLTLTGSATNGTGNNLGNTLTGNGAANLLSGASGNDTLSGSGGADTLDGGTGNDSMAGGTGNDSYVVNSALDVVTEIAAGGTADLIQSSVSITALAAEVEKLTLTGGGNLNGTGNGLNNTLTGNTGNNVLDGLAGNDTMAGGAGDDTYVVDSAGDKVTEASSAGADRVQSSVTYTLGTNLENLTLTGSGASNGTGNTVANTLTGNNAANALAGLGANDSLTGSGGADTLDGGTGNDTLTGGTGKDKFDFTAALSAGNADTIADFSAVDDTIRLDNDIFTAFVTENVGLAGNAFYAGVAAHDATDRIIYDAGTGNLYYDADGTGAAAAKLFATLATMPTIAANDFFIIA